MDFFVQFWNTLKGMFLGSGFFAPETDFRTYIMLLISFVLIYLAIKKQ